MARSASDAPPTPGRVRRGRRRCSRWRVRRTPDGCRRHSATKPHEAPSPQQPAGTPSGPTEVCRRLPVAEHLNMRRQVIADKGHDPKTLRPMHRHQPQVTHPTRFHNARHGCPYPKKAGGAHGEALPPGDSSHKQRLCRIICLHTTSANMRHIPTHRRSGCAAMRRITREMNRYMTQNPRNESNSAPSRLLMAHISTHFAPETRERTHGNDERTRGIDVRTRPGCERTRDSRTNPGGQFVAGWEFSRLISCAFRPLATTGTERCPTSCRG